MAQHLNIADIARLANVSVSTVSRVLNEHPDVSEATRQRVLDVIHTQAYVPNNSARNLKLESLHAVGLVVKGFTNPFFTPMIEVIQAELERHRYMVLLHPVDPEADELESAILLHREKKPEGMIFLGGNFQHSRQRLALLPIPFAMATMSMHRGVDRATFSSVTVDDFAEGYEVGRRVCRAGHSRVALIGHSQSDLSISRLRLEGFEKAFADSGCAPQGLCADYAGDFTMEGGYEAAARLLQKHDFTCLFCVADTIALGALRAIHDAGRHIPKDVSVIGFDGITAALYAIPSLATVRQPSRQMARQSVRMLLDNMAWGAPHQHQVLQAEFIQGESFIPHS